MELLEEHPVLWLPLLGEMAGLGEVEVNGYLEARCDAIERERVDPLRYGFRPEVWDVCDDLLRGGVRVVLDCTRLGRLGVKGDPVPVEMRGESILWIAGSQRSSKTEYAGRKCVEVLVSGKRTRGWSFADNATKSRAQQQPVVWKYLPFELRRMCERSGKWRSGSETNVGYNLKTGFTDDSLAIFGSSHWFKNYEQDIGQVEGDQLDIIWLDELRNLELLKTLRFRMGDRGGLIIATFTSISEKFSAIDREFNQGSTTLLEVEAPLLPVRGRDGNETGQYEKVPRIKRAGSGSDGDLRANIVYFHITDNPYYGWEARRPNEQKSGAQRFYELLKGAPREKVLSRAYGILTTGAAQAFPLFREAVHVVKAGAVPPGSVKGRFGEKVGVATNYMVLDPCSGRNWAFVWIRVTRDERWWVYREWPTHGHVGAYIQGVGDPGPWACPSSEKMDGEKGPAQTPFGFGLLRYRQEIAQAEGEEEIFERWIDSRYGASPTTQYEGNTTLIEQLEGLGLSFLAASGKSIKEGIDLINDKLYYDEGTKIGEFSKDLARVNVPQLMVSENCPNTIFALKEWTGKDGEQGACKDFVDLLRYALLARLSYVGKDSYVWRKLA